MKKVFSVLVVALCLSAAVTASAAGDRAASNTTPPITVWTNAPAFFSPAGSGRTALTDAAQPMPYIPLVPCRQYDSRSFTPLADNTPRAVTLSGSPCGIPASARAVAVNITVLNISGAGSNGVFRVDTVSPPTVGWINYPFTETQRANAGVVGLNGSAQIVVQVNQGAGSVDFIVDVFGYYGATPANASNYFQLYNNSGGYTMYLTNSSTTCGGACGLYASVGSGIAIYGSGPQGVYGYASGTGVTFGVQGTINTGAGAGSAGIYGLGANVAAGKSYAVLGETADNTSDSSAIEGRITGAGAIQGLGTGWVPAGVRGEGSNTGVWGFANTYAVFGRSYTTAGALTAWGVLGYNNGSTTFGAYGAAGSSGTTNWGVYAGGNLGASGTKPFVEPHPTQAGVVIRYVALEGPEAGTYFRGRGRFVGRQAVIEVPEDFRLVTDSEGLSIQITPIGDFSQVAVVSMGLDSIELKSTRDVEFFFTVNGVRRTFRDWQVTVHSDEFRPAGPSATIPEYLSAEQKKNLIRNGTYNPDGTVNMSTARQAGWDLEWAKQSTELGLVKTSETK